MYTGDASTSRCKTIGTTSVHCTWEGSQYGGGVQAHTVSVRKKLASHQCRSGAGRISAPIRTRGGTRRTLHR
jgi:hypothetical protein